MSRAVADNYWHNPETDGELPLSPTITALKGTNVDADGDLITDIATAAGVRIIDIIGVVDKHYPATDKIYDSAAPLGPRGSYLPAGVFRDESTATSAWCNSTFLDFDVAANANAIRTPGAPNTTCTLASITVVGTPCLTGPGTSGGPDLSATDPVIGGNCDLTVSNAGTGAVGFAYLSIPNSPTPFLNCEIHLWPGLLINLGAMTFASGTATLSLPVPVATSFVNVSFAVQAAVGVKAQLHLTNGILGVSGYN